MFTLNHFIWLGITIIIVVGMFLLIKYCKLSYETVLTIMCIVCAISELVKIFNNMELGYKDGRFLDPGSLPFHLCSIQIFFFFALKFFVKKESTKEKLLGFMFPTGIAGGVCALLIPTCGVAFNKVQPYQYFIFHAFIVFFAIYIIKEKIVTITLKTYLYNLAFLAVFVLFDLWINSILSYANTNFMYLSRPPMDNLPILNLKHGWYVYFAHLVCVGTILFSLIHLPFILIERKMKRINTVS